MRLIAIVIACWAPRPVAAAQGVEAPKDAVSGSGNFPLEELDALLELAPGSTRREQSHGRVGRRFGHRQVRELRVGHWFALRAGREQQRADGGSWRGMAFHRGGARLGAVRQTAAVAADQLMVSVEWQRLWENGARLPNGPQQGAQKITLRNG